MSLQPLRYYDRDDDDRDDRREGQGGKGQGGKDGDGHGPGKDGGKGGKKGSRKPVPIVPARAASVTARPIVPPRPEIRPKLMPTSPAPKSTGAWMQAWLWVPFVPGGSPGDVLPPGPPVAQAKAVYSGSAGPDKPRDVPECPAPMAAPVPRVETVPTDDSEHNSSPAPATWFKLVKFWKLK